MDYNIIDCITIQSNILQYNTIQCNIIYRISILNIQYNIMPCKNIKHHYDSDRGKGFMHKLISYTEYGKDINTLSGTN